MGTYAIGDIHSCFKEFLELKERIEKKDPNARFILMGDVIGKGPSDEEMLRWLYDHITADGKYQMILGNHDDNFMEVFGQGQLETLASLGREQKEDVKIDREEFSHLEDKPEKMFAYAKFLAQQPLVKKIETNGKKYILAHGWYDPTLQDKFAYRKCLLIGRQIKKDGSIIKHFQGDGKLLIGHIPTAGKIPAAIGTEQGKIWDFETETYIDCGLVFKVQQLSHLGKRFGNLAAYELETGHVEYLW